MPSAHIIDLRELDLSHIAYGEEQILEACQQRGPFQMLDGIYLVDPERDLIAGFVEVRHGDWWTKYHIPSRPIFPGALMIESAAQLCTFFHHHSLAEDDETFFGFGGLNNTRFRGTVEPDCRMNFVARCTRKRSRMYSFVTQAFVEEKMVFETEIFGVII